MTSIDAISLERKKKSTLKNINKKSKFKSNTIHQGFISGQTKNSILRPPPKSNTPGARFYPKSDIQQGKNIPLSLKQISVAKMEIRRRQESIDT